MFSGAELLESLGKRGTELNTVAQKLAVCCKGGDGYRKLNQCFQGRRKKWPSVPQEAAHLRASVIQAWTNLEADMQSYAQQLVKLRPGSNVKDIEEYLRNVVLAKLALEPTSPPSELALPCSPFSERDISRLAARGFFATSIPSTSGINVVRLHDEILELYQHGVISPSNSSCNPGAHGINVRCGTTAERERLDDGTPTLRAAMELLRSMPHALEQSGYVCFSGAEELQLAVPGVCLVSAYPPGARYTRHLDCYGEDNARALTLILYVNDAGWSTPDDGGALRLEPVDGSVSCEVVPSGGTLVVFESRRVWHEVLPSKRLRFAITLWVYGAPTAAHTALRTQGQSPTPTSATSTSNMSLTQAQPEDEAQAPLLTLVRDTEERTAWTFS